MDARLEGKTALVNGATSNVGRAIAVSFGTQGALAMLGQHPPEC